MQTLNVKFRVPESLLSVLKGVALPMPQNVADCPLVVGDVIAYPPPHQLALRLAARVYVPGTTGAPGCWNLLLEQTEYPQV